MSSAESSIPPLNPSPYGRRILWLCTPSWGASVWVTFLIIVHELHVMPLQNLTLSKPVLTLVSMTALISPLCWAAAVVFAVRSESTSRGPKIALVLSGLAIVITWIVILHYIRRH